MTATLTPPKLYVERSSRGYVEAGVRGTNIKVLKQIASVFRAPTVSIAAWEAELSRVASEAEREVRLRWKDAFAAIDAPPSNERGSARL